MMVIQHTRGGTTTVYPADRCNWRIADSTGDSGLGTPSRGYTINTVVYEAAGATTQLDNSADIVAFGYIGKTGRFVALSEYFTQA